MAQTREAPQEFVRELRRRFPDFQDLRYNNELSRWEFIFLSQVGRPVSLFWGWFHNPLTGERIEPDPTTGLPPFRDLDPEARTEIVSSLEKTFIANPYDAWGSHDKKAQAAREYNASLRRQRIRAKANNFADMIGEVDLRRPWIKHHKPRPRGQGPVFLPPRRSVS